MDTRHRHDLEHNDLQDFFTHFGEWWGRWGTYVLVGLLAVVGTFAAMRYFQSRSAHAREQAWADLAGTQDPESLAAIADDYRGRNSAVSALAALRAGDAWLVRIAQPAAMPATQPKEDRATTLKRAEDVYRSVVDDPAAAPLFKLNAELGLAAVAENRGDWKAAQGLYDQVARDAGDRYTAIREQAQGKAAMLGRLDRPLAFSADKPATLPATLPDPGLIGPPAPPATASAPATRPVATRPAQTLPAMLPRPATMPATRPAASAPAQP